MLRVLIYTFILFCSGFPLLVGQHLTQSKAITLSFGSGEFKINDQVVKKVNTESMECFFGKADSVVKKRGEFRNFTKGSDGMFHDGVSFYYNWIYYYNKLGIYFITKNTSPDNMDSLNLRMTVLVNDSFPNDQYEVTRMKNSFHGKIFFDGKPFDYKADYYIADGSCKDSLRLAEIKKMLPANCKWYCRNGNPDGISYSGGSEYSYKTVRFEKPAYRRGKRLQIFKIDWVAD